MKITKEQLKTIMPNAEKNIKSNPHTKFCGLETIVALFNEHAVTFGVSTPTQWAYFLAQIAHESCEFRYTEELASGAAYDTGKLAVRLGNTPQKDGDGQKYKGRGYIQLTGLSNYKAFNAWYRANGGTEDFVKNPEKLSDMLFSALSAFWFWSKNNLNRFADKKDFVGLTRAINGGTNGLNDRLKYKERAVKVFSV